MNRRKKTLYAIFWSGIKGWGAQLISFSVFTVLAWVLDPEAYGIIAMASVFMVFIAIFQDQGMSYALVQTKNLDPEHIDTAFWSNIIIGTCLVLCCQVMAKPIADFYSQPQVESIIQLLSLTILIRSLAGVPVALLQRSLKFKSLAFRTLLSESIGGGVAIYLAYQNYGVYSLVAQRIVSSITQVVVVWLNTSWRPSLRFSIPHFKELFNFGINILGIKMTDFAIRQSDSLLIGYYLGPTALGFYNIAYRFHTLLRDLISGFAKPVAFSTMSAVQTEPSKLRESYFTLTRFAAMIACPMFIGVIVLAPDLMVGLFGEKWSSSILVLQILCLAGMLNSVAQFGGSVMMATGHPKWIVRLDLLNAIFSVICFYIVVEYGIEAVALAFVVRAYALSPLQLIVIKRLIQIDYKVFLQGILPPLLAATAMGVLVWQLNEELLYSIGTAGKLSMAACVGASLYALFLYLLDPSLIKLVRSMLKMAK